MDVSVSDDLRQIAAPPFADRRTRPIWLQIYDRLGGAITSGLLPEASKLPGEEDLAALFGVTRVTLRRALARHRREGRLCARKGVGVFVRSLSARYVVHPDEAFHHPLGADGITTETLSLRRRPAGEETAGLFGVEPEDEVIELRTLSSAGAAPFYLAVKDFPADIFPDFETAYRDTGTILGAYASGGVTRYERAETRILGDVAGEGEAALVNLDAGASVLRSRTINVDRRGRVIEFNRGCWPLFSVELVFGLGEGPAPADLASFSLPLSTPAARR